MSKFVPDAVIDTLLDEVATATLMSVTSDISTPANLDNMLADVAMTPGDGNDYNIADGTSSGRKVTTVQKADVDIDGLAGTNDALHIVLSLGGTILDITTCTSQPLTNGGTVTFPAWSHEVADPS